MDIITPFDDALGRLDVHLEEEKQSDTDFEFEPVPLNVFVRDRKYLGLPPLGEKQYEAVEYATQIYLPHTLKELGWKQKRYVKELVLLWGKGCKSHRNSMINIDTGEIKTIKDWTDEERRLWVKSLNQRSYGRELIGNEKTSIPWLVGKDKVYKVTLSDGSVSDVNETHKFFKHRHSGGYRAKGDWVQLKALNVGDRIAISTYEYETEKKYDKGVLWFLGMIIGDGNCSDVNRTVSWYVSEKKTELKERMKTVVEKFDCALVHKGCTGWSETTERYIVLSNQLKCNLLKRELKKFGVSGCNAYTKFVPKEIYTYTKECRVEFLRGLLETDGWVSQYDAGGQCLTEIGYSSASKDLVLGVKRLLASLGVRSRLFSKKVKSEYGIHYTVRVRDNYNGKKLLAYLGWGSKGKWECKKSQEKCRLIFEKIVSIEYVGEEDVYDLEVEGTHNYVDADGFLNHNSGKDYVARIIHMRIAYLCLCLKNPQAYYFHPEMRVGLEPIHLLNTASTKEQAGNVFFSPLRKYLKQSPFFRNKVDVLTTEIRFEKAIYLYSGHSQAEAMEGLNLMAVVLDEIAAFKTDDEVADIKRMRLRKNIPQSAGSLYDFAHTSVSTRFPEVGKVILLSFPRFRGDFIMQKYDEGLRNKRVYTSKGATFDINPTKKRSDFKDERLTKPELYQARIECNPGLAEDAFFKNEFAIRRSFKLELEDPIDKTLNRYKSWFICRDEFPRYGHCDLAKNRCRAAFSFVHAYGTEPHKLSIESKEVIVDLPLIRLDVIMYFESPHGGEINFEEIQDRILEFTEERGFRIELLTFDGYNSIMMMQNLDKKNIRVDEQSVDRTRDAYETWQDVMYEGRFISYYNKILVEQEIPFLIDDKGRKIIHRQGRNKDGTDAVAGAIHNCIVDEPWGSYDFWVDTQGGDNVGDSAGSWFK